MWKRCTQVSAGNVEILSLQEVARAPFLHTDRGNPVVPCSRPIEDPPAFLGRGIGSYQSLPLSIRVRLRQGSQGIHTECCPKDSSADLEVLVRQSMGGEG